jgi:hypothetical protein
MVLAVEVAQIFVHGAAAATARDRRNFDLVLNFL